MREEIGATQYQLTTCIVFQIAWDIDKPENPKKCRNIKKHYRLLFKLSSSLYVFQIRHFSRNKQIQCLYKFLHAAVMLLRNMFALVVYWVRLLSLLKSSGIQNYRLIGSAQVMCGWSILYMVLLYEAMHTSTSKYDAQYVIYSYV